jgi:hypothetical protein
MIAANTNPTKLHDHTPNLGIRPSNPGAAPGAVSTPEVRSDRARASDSSVRSPLIVPPRRSIGGALRLRRQQFSLRATTIIGARSGDVVT